MLTASGRSLCQTLQVLLLMQTRLLRFQADVGATPVACQPDNGAEQPA